MLDLEMGRRRRCGRMIPRKVMVLAILSGWWACASAQTPAPGAGNAAGNTTTAATPVTGAGNATGNATAAATPAPAAAEPAPVAVAPTGKVELFNGKDFSGWTFFMKGGTDPLKTWSVANGTIECTGKPNGYARTTTAYKDYTFTVEWRFVKACNTGVVANIQPPEKMTPWPDCIECQGLHDHQGDFWFWSGATCAELKTLPPEKLAGSRKNGFARPGPSVEKPVGEWNTFTVIADGDTIKIVVNGQLVNTATKCAPSSGWIGLQSEGGPIEVRKVTLDTAAAGEAALAAAKP